LNSFHKEECGPRDSKKSSSSSSKKSFVSERKISDADPCPIHEHEHTWGACHANCCSKRNQKGCRRDDKNKNKNNDTPAAKSGTNYGVQSSDKKNDPDDEKMDSASNDGSVLNEENMNDCETGDSFTTASTVADMSSFALTDIFMSNFDFQTNEESSATASESHMDCMLDACISGDGTSKIDEMNYVNNDAKASPSLRPIGLVSFNKCRMQ
jgi:hypothetical protein